MGTPLVELSHLGLRFASQGPTLFEDLSWSLPDPCWVALVGPSGSGKTSLIHIVAGLERPSSGQVRVAGQDILSLDDPALSRYRQTVVGTAFQHFHLQSERSALDNLLLPLYFSGQSLQQGRERATQLAQALDLEASLAKPVSQLSGGQRQRLALIRALMNRPRLLLADEPIGNLDSESAARVLALLQAEHRAGLSLLVVTHDDFLLQGAEQVFRLQAGCLERLR